MGNSVASGREPVLPWARRRIASRRIASSWRSAPRSARSRSPGRTRSAAAACFPDLPSWPCPCPCSWRCGNTRAGWPSCVATQRAPLRFAVPGYYKIRFRILIHFSLRYLFINFFVDRKKDLSVFIWCDMVAIRKINHTSFCSIFFHVILDTPAAAVGQLRPTTKGPFTRGVLCGCVYVMHAVRYILSAWRAVRSSGAEVPPPAVLLRCAAAVMMTHIDANAQNFHRASSAYAMSSSSVRNVLIILRNSILLSSPLCASPTM